MADINLKGMGVALITPFKEDESVDYEALGRLVDYLLQNGADYLVVLGTTAETPTLTEEEKKKIIELVVTKVRHRIPIVLGVGGNCTKSVVDKLKNDNFEGIDAILSVVPYYNKPSQEGIYQHYKAIAQATELPVILYNVPGRTGVNMTAETTLRLAREFKNIIAVKEASGNITQMDDIIKNKPKDFNVISGDDGITFPLITLGAIGVISAMILKTMGAGKVIGADRSKLRIEQIRKTGLLDVVDTADDNWLQQIQEMTAKEGVDVVIEATGAPQVLNEAMKTARTGAKIVVASVYSGFIPEFEPLPIMRKELTIVGAKGPAPLVKTDGTSAVVDKVMQMKEELQKIISVYAIISY